MMLAALGRGDGIGNTAAPKGTVEPSRSTGTIVESLKCFECSPWSLGSTARTSANVVSVDDMAPTPAEACRLRCAFLKKRTARDAHTQNYRNGPVDIETFCYYFIMKWCFQMQ